MSLRSGEGQAQLRGPTTAPGDRWARRLKAWLPLALVVAALSLRLWHLDARSIWLDESFTALHSVFPAWDLWTQAITNKPPLFYHITAAFWSPGDGEFWLRLPAALFGTATVMLGWLLGHRLAGMAGGLVLGLLLLVSDLNVAFSQNARHYTLLTVGWLLVLLGVLRLVDERTLPRPSAGALALLGVGAVVMLHSHPVAIHFLFAAGLAYLVVLATTKRWSVARLAMPIGALVLAGLTLLPWLPVVIRMFADGDVKFHWLAQPTPGDALRQFATLFGGNGNFDYPDARWAPAVAVTLAVLGGTGLVHYFSRRDAARGSLLIGTLLLPPLLIWLTGVWKPMYMQRTIMPAHVSALAGLMLLVVAPPRPILRAALTGLLTAVLAVSTAGYLLHHRQDDWRGLAQQYRERAGSHDMLYLCRDYWYSAVEYYLGERMPATISPDVRAPGNRPLDMRGQAQSLRCRGWPCGPLAVPESSTPPETIWVVNRHWDAMPCQRSDVLADLQALTGVPFSDEPVWTGDGLALIALRPVTVHAPEQDGRPRSRVEEAH